MNNTDLYLVPLIPNLHIVEHFSTPFIIRAKKMGPIQCEASLLTAPCAPVPLSFSINNEIVEASHSRFNPKAHQHIF